MRISKHTRQAKAASRVARWSAAVVAALLVVLGVVACGGNAAPAPTVTVTVGGSPSASPVSTPTASPSSSAAATMSLKVYFLRPIGGSQPARGPFIATAARAVPATPAPAAAAVRLLLAGPIARERAIGMSTAIPVGTTLRGLTIAGGVATVDLSGTFAVSGTVAAGGGTLSTRGRLAQVVYTLTQFPSVSKGVVFRLDGRVVTVFGSQGMTLSHAQKRSDYESLTPPIFVDSPAAFAVVKGTLRVSGTADVFEATFRARVVRGTKQGTTTVTATSGSGTRGTFSFALRAPGTVPTGSLVVWDPSAEDGSPLHTVTIPLSFAP
jgi:spore germination protein GerM